VGRPRSCRRGAPWLLALGLLAAAGQALGFWGWTVGLWPYVPQYGARNGAVYARSVVPGPNGQPVYVEHDPDSGAEGVEIGEAVGELAGAQVLAGRRVAGLDGAAR
jgi:hypothetical protein